MKKECDSKEALEVKKHPSLNILVREDGSIYRLGETRDDFKEWTLGSFNKSNGYYRLRIYGQTYLVHRLVAETFIENPDGKPTVDHINHIRTDNRVSNLRWATQSEQRENSSQVLERADYGVRETENPKLYHSNWTKKNIIHVNEYNKQRYRKRVAAGFRYVATSSGHRWLKKEIADAMKGIPVKERIIPQEKEIVPCN